MRIEEFRQRRFSQRCDQTFARIVHIQTSLARLHLIAETAVFFEHVTCSASMLQKDFATIEAAFIAPSSMFRVAQALQVVPHLVGVEGAAKDAIVNVSNEQDKRSHGCIMFFDDRISVPQHPEDATEPSSGTGYLFEHPKTPGRTP